MSSSLYISNHSHFSIHSHFSVYLKFFISLSKQLLKRARRVIIMKNGKCEEGALPKVSCSLPFPSILLDTMHTPPLLLMDLKPPKRGAPGVPRVARWHSEDLYFSGVKSGSNFKAFTIINQQKQHHVQNACIQRRHCSLLEKKKQCLPASIQNITLILQAVNFFKF
ncbi:hypothetical protein Ahy_A03g016262 isoform B [Arachis hypogaea]|uniref:Uncharacterized protein n=1 Tax=Arachis hypogaea TaxID=3818 RepID=A0A445E2R4_ARAHY|nr:hypothetical protein Ahy_A03g016262 isoform B [Arachis hypogaea]